MELTFSLRVFVYLCIINSISSVKYEKINECEYHKQQGDDDKSWNDYGLTWICGVKNPKSKFIVYYDKEPLAIECSNVRPGYGYYLEWLKKIDFRNCRLPALTKNYFETFPNLHTLNVSDVELETMQLDIFKSAKKMETLDISHNKLTEIPSEIFAEAIQLANADFSHNFIERIASTAIKGARNLKILNLSYNKLNKLDSNALPLPNLLTLDLSYIGLTILPEHIFDKLRKLKQLNLSGTPFRQFNINTFSHLFQLKHLNLKETALSNIKLGTFSQLRKLVSLDLSGNMLTKLDFGLFLPVQHELRSLQLNDNQLTDLNGFRNQLFPRLNSLDIQKNNFSCAYMTHFMDSINWKQTHLHMHIRGISCDGNLTIIG